MKQIKIMINGLPGNVAAIVAKHALEDNRFDVICESLTGPEIEETEHTIGSTAFRLSTPDKHDVVIDEIKKKEKFFISIDYTHPSAVNSNAEFYCKNNLPFVMGTTGGDREALMQTVISSSIPAVIAPNMAKQIVGFQAMMAYASETFPNLFKDYSLEIVESHQKGKADTSGTAKAMVTYYNKLGINFSVEEIKKERDPKVQKEKMGIPEEYLDGHAWHTYTLTSKDNTARFSFTHNINGRDIYSLGTLDAVLYLYEKINKEKKGKVFSMIDVLKG